MTKRNHKFPIQAIFLCLIFAACAGVVFAHLKTKLEPPAIMLTDPGRINAKTPLHITVSGLDRPVPGKNPEILLVRNGLEYLLRPRSHDFDAKTGHLSLQVFLSDHPEPLDGEILLKVSAYNKPGTGIFDEMLTTRTQRSFKVEADLSLPRADAFLSPQALTRGGAALLVITPSETLSALKLSSGRHEYLTAAFGPEKYAALAAFPQDLGLEDYDFTLQLVDLAGNTSSLELALPAREFVFRSDNIRLNDKFFAAKHHEFKECIGKDASSLELFLLMNSKVRLENYATLRALCAASSPERLWSGAFLEMPGAVRRSEFADRRNYLYNGKVIDQQVHLGLDYASSVKDKIPAANSGIVAFRGHLGIHGQAVLVDHGLGLFSLYSHLSDIIVEQRQRIEKGQIIGHTGTTGMADGDHLHFEILVNGISVNPDFFFNEEWMELNVNAPLAELAKVAN